MPFLFPRQKPILEELMNRETREKVTAATKKDIWGVLANLTTEAIEMYNMPTGAFVEVWRMILRHRRQVSVKATSS